MTYNFIKQADGSVRLFVETVYKRTFIGAALIDVVDSDSFDVIDSTGGRHRYELTEKHLDGSVTTNSFQVSGEDITGTVEEVCQELDTVFPKANSSSGGTGGTGGRFGYPGEDETNTEARQFDGGGNPLSITNLDLIDITAGAYPTFGLIHADNYGAKLQNRRAGEGDVGFVLDAGAKEASVQITNFAPSGPTALTNNGFYVQPTWSDNYDDGDQFLGRFTGTIPGQPECDIRVPAVPGIHYLPLIPTQQFASNAAAVAALGVGELYKSTTLINGSPIILITE